MAVAAGHRAFPRVTTGPGLGLPSRGPWARDATPITATRLAMDASQFEARADAALARLQQAVESAAGDAVDAELVGGILTLELEAGGVYQINKHLASRQIWLSSPVSGAWHFAWSEGEGGAWRATRGGEKLEDLLGRELTESLGEAVALG